jgi:hypothetical protein
MPKMGNAAETLEGILIFNLLVTAVMMLGFFRAMKRSPLVPRPLKIRHFLLSFLALMLTADNAYYLLLLILHPDLILTVYYRPEGLAPAWFMAPLDLAITLLGTFLCMAASLLARRVSKARPVFLRVWPVYVLLSIVSFIPVAEKKGVLAFPIFFMALLGGAGLFVWWHFRTPGSDLLFEPSAKERN